MSWKLAIVLIVGLTAATLAVLHVKGTNGAWYYPWHWRRLGWHVYPLTFLAAAPFFIAHWLYHRGRIKVGGAIALVAVAAFAVQLATSIAQPPGWRRIIKSIEDPTNTSYYSAAAVIHNQLGRNQLPIRAFLEVYPELMPTLMLHASYKPPGWVLYYYVLIDLFGVGAQAAVVGALGVAMLAAAGVPATYALMRDFKFDELASLSAASFFALTPSLILFFPQGDQAYPALGCMMIIAWKAALERQNRGWLMAAAFGTLLAVGLFFSAVFLMLGLFLAVYTILHIADHGRAGFIRAIERSVVAVLTICALYILLAAATGFDPIETFFTAARRSQAHLVELARPWPLHNLLDIIDIALGTGWISAPLILFGSVAAWRNWDWRQPQFRAVFVGLLQLATAIAVAVFPGENARLMLPLMPLLMAPIGLELSRWPIRNRMIVYAVLTLILAVYAQNMVFLNVDPDYHFELNVPP